MLRPYQGYILLFFVIDVIQVKMVLFLNKKSEGWS